MQEQTESQQLFAKNIYWMKITENKVCEAKCTITVILHAPVFRHDTVVSSLVSSLLTEVKLMVHVSTYRIVINKS